MLRITELQKGDRVQALKNIDLDITAGRVYTIKERMYNRFTKDYVASVESNLPGKVFFIGRRSFLKFDKV